MNKSIAHIVHVCVCVVRTFQVYSLTSKTVTRAAVIYDEGSPLIPYLPCLYLRFENRAFTVN